MTAYARPTHHEAGTRAERFVRASSAIAFSSLEQLPSFNAAEWMTPRTYRLDAREAAAYERRARSRPQCPRSSGDIGERGIRPGHGPLRRPDWRILRAAMYST